MVKFTRIGNRDVAGRFTRIVARKRSAFRQASRDGAADILRRWRQLTRSRRIARGLKVTQEGDARITVSVDSSIGFNPVFEEEDTKPHPIRIKNKRVLTDGERFFGPEVKHPGTTGSYAGRRAVEDSGPAFKRRIIEVWQREEGV